LIETNITAGGQLSKPEFEERYAVTMFGFTNELLEASRTPLELVELVLETGLAKNIEIDGPQFFRNFPNVEPAEVTALGDLLADYGAKLSLLGGYTDRAAGATLHASDSVVSSLLKQIELVSQLGGFGLRVQVDAFTTDEAPQIARAAEALGVKVLLEMQGSMTPSDPRTQATLVVVEAAASANVRLMFDGSLFMTCIPPTLKTLMQSYGLTPSQVNEIETHWLEDSTSEYRGWLLENLKSGTFPPRLNALLPTLLTRIGHSTPSDWEHVASLVESVHLKYWDTSDELGAVSLPTTQLMQLLDSQGYQGYYCSEWGGHEWHTLQELPAFKAISWHKQVVEACYG
jgi:hypothetical protein